VGVLLFSGYVDCGFWGIVQFQWRVLGGCAEGGRLIVSDLVLEYLCWFWGRKEFRTPWFCIFRAVFCCTWSVRVFRNLYSLKQLLWDWIVFLSSLWCRALGAFRGVS
jgi:hypothetical protein